MQDYISDWFIPMDFGYDIPDEEPDGEDKSGMKEYIYLILFLIIGIVVGNRVFNHLHAWLGVTIISATIIFFIYKLIKTLKDEKTD